MLIYPEQSLTPEVVEKLKKEWGKHNIPENLIPGTLIPSDPVPLELKLNTFIREMDEIIRLEREAARSPGSKFRVRGMEYVVGKLKRHLNESNSKK